jgi:hypothetical protein
MEDWHRGDWFDATDLPWVNPSPNMRSLNAARSIRGWACWSTPGISVGRGTDSPFEQIGADFIGGRELAAYLNQRQIPGVRVYPTSFTPSESNFKGVRIEGVRFEIVNREMLDATRLGLEVAGAIQKLYPGKVDWAVNKRLIGSDEVIRRASAYNPRGRFPADGFRSDSPGNSPRMRIRAIHFHHGLLRGDPVAGVHMQRIIVSIRRVDHRSPVSRLVAWGHGEDFDRPSLLGGPQEEDQARTDLLAILLAAGDLARQVGHEILRPSARRKQKQSGNCVTHPS